MKLYLAGPMRGIAEFNFPAFDEATAALFRNGHDVHNPAEWDRSQHGFDPDGLTGNEDLADLGFDLSDALAHDLNYVCREADGVAVLDGWERSSGARAEVAAAIALGKPVRQVACWTDDCRFPDECRFHLVTEVPPRNGTVDANTAAVAAYARNNGERLRRDEEVRVTSETGGEKGQKLAQLGAVDADALLTVARVAGFGAQKYARYNYMRGYDWSLSFDALQRHLLSFWAGEDLDPESGLPHLGHAAWHCLALLSFTQRGLGTDDRYKAAS